MTKRALVLLLVLAAIATVWVTSGTPRRERAHAASLALPGNTGGAATLLAPIAAGDAGPRATAVSSAADVAHAAPTAAELARELWTEEAPRLGVFGRVVDERGASIAGAELALRDWARGDPSMPVRIALSDAEGVFAGECPHFRSRRDFLVFADGRASAEIRVRDGVAGSLQLGTVVLGAGTEITGTVVDESGRAVANAWVCAYPAESYPTDPEAARHGGLEANERVPVFRSGSDGRFRLRGIPPGQRFVAAQQDSSRLFGWDEPFDVVLGVVRDVRVVAPADERRDARAIAGIVRAPDGTPLADVDVRGIVPDRVVFESSGSDGRFELRGDWKEPVKLLVTDPELRHPTFEVHGVAPGTRELELAFGAPAWLALAVRDPAGAPVPGAHVRSARSRENRAFVPEIDLGCGGAVRIPRPIQPLELEVRAPGFRTRRFGPFEPGTLGAELVLVLESGQALCGRVTFEGRPVAGAAIDLCVTDAPGTWRESEAVAALDRPFAIAGVVDLRACDGTTDAGGAFVVTIPADGWYGVRVDAEDFATTVHGPVELAMEGRDGLEIELERPGAIEGRAWPAGDGATRVVGVSDGWGYARTTPVDEHGRFRFDGLAPGSYQVRACVPPVGARQPLRGRVERDDPIAWDCVVRAGTTTRFDLDLTRAGACVLAGRLEFGDEDPRAWWAELEDPASGGRRAFAEVERDGRFRLAVGAPGRYRLVIARSRQSFEQEIELVEGETAWSLRCATGTLSLLPAGAVPERARGSIRFVQEGTPRFVATVELVVVGAGWSSSVPSGRGRLEIRDAEDGAPRTLAELEIRAGEETSLALPAAAF